MTLMSLARFAHPATGLAASISAEGSSTVIALRGEGDLETLPDLVSLLAVVIAEHEGAVVVDLEEADFLDTASARVIGRTAQYLGERGRRLTVRSASRQAEMVLAAFRLTHLLGTTESFAPASEDC